MKKELVLSIIQKRWVMLCLFVMMCIFGYYPWEQLSVKTYPDIVGVVSQVVVQVPGPAAEKMEQQMTILLEHVISGLPGMHVMRSRSTFGLSMITIVFRDGTGDYWSRQRVQEGLNGVELPYGAVPGLDPLTSPVGKVYRYIIEGDQYSLRELTDLQNRVIIPHIKEVSRMADVTNLGGITTQFQAEVNPSKLEQYNLSLSQAVEATENNNANAGGSVLNRGSLGYVVRGIGLIGNLDDLGHIVMSTTSGVPVFLNGIGSLKYGSLEGKGVLGYVDRTRNYSESLEGIVLLLKHENLSEILEDIRVAVDELDNETLPEGARIHTSLDRADSADTTLSATSYTLLMGMALMILMLILFLGNWRGALLVPIAIPMSSLIVFILMYPTDIPVNLLSLGAIDFGIIMDGAIVILETTLEKHKNNLKRYFEEKSMAQRVKEMGRPILFSTIVIIMAYLPLSAFEHIKRKLFTPMVFMMSYAMIGALLVALLLVPGLAHAIYRKPHKIYRNKWPDRLKNKYTRTITGFLEAPLKATIPSRPTLTVGIVLSVVVGKDFLPELDEGSIWLQVNLSPEIPVEKLRKLSDTLCAYTMKHSEVTYIAIQARRSDDGTDPFAPSHFGASVGIKPYDKWPKGKVRKDLIHELEEEYKLLPGSKVGFSRPMIGGMTSEMARAHNELVVKVYDEDFCKTCHTIEEVTRALRIVRGAVDLDIDREPPSPQLQISMNRDAIVCYELSVSDVADLIEVAVGGKTIAQLYQDDRQYGIACKYKEETRNIPEKVAGLMLTSPTNAKIPLSQVADVRLSVDESTITREINRRHLTVKLDLHGRNLTSFLSEAQNTTNEKVRYNKNKCTIKWGGAFENQKRAYMRLAVIIPLTLTRMLILFYVTFGKFRQTGLVLAIIPLVLFGGMLTLNAHGMTLSVFSAVGFIAMLRLSIQNEIIMVSQVSGLCRGGMELWKSVIEGARQRLRPILMTLVTTILRLSLALLATRIGNDVRHLLAIVIVYGLMFSTLISISLLPASYHLVENNVLNKKKNDEKEHTI